MAEEFCYRALDAQGQSREGVVKAVSPAQVKAYLASQGLTAVRIDARRTPTASPVSPRRRQFRGPSGLQRLPEVRLDSGKVWGVCALLAVLGLAWMNLQPETNGTRRPSNVASEARNYRLEIRGEVIGSVPARLPVTLVFPQIPYQLRRRWNELEHPKPHEFRWRVEFRSEVPASQCFLRLGKQQESRRQQVLPGVDKLDLGSMRYLVSNTLFRGAKRTEQELGTNVVARPSV
jgi:hypothetical protein